MSPAHPSNLHVIKDSQGFQTILNDPKNKDKLIVVKFTASWCGPCKAITPAVFGLANEHSDIHILEVDVDDNEDLAREYGIKAMPTFMYFLNGKKLDTELTGANAERLRSDVLGLKPKNVLKA